MLRHLILFSAAFALICSCFGFAMNDTIKVDGGLISGTISDGVRSFKGIPFAAPPVGDLRWKAPQPVVPWEGVARVPCLRPGVSASAVCGGINLCRAAAEAERGFASTSMCGRRAKRATGCRSWFGFMAAR